MMNRTIREVTVIGAGVMGGDIAAWCALQGYQVTLQARTPKSIAAALERAFSLFKKRLYSPRIVRNTMDRLMPDTGGAGLGKADIIIEAILEDKDAKQLLYKEIEPLMKSDALLATNTSSIPLEDLATVLSRPERLVGLHFFNPVVKMPLVEIIAGESTDPEEVSRAMAFVHRIDRLDDILGVLLGDQSPDADDSSRPAQRGPKPQTAQQQGCRPPPGAAAPRLLRGRAADQTGSRRGSGALAPVLREYAP